MIVNYLSKVYQGLEIDMVGVTQHENDIFYTTDTRKVFKSVTASWIKISENPMYFLYQFPLVIEGGNVDGVY